MVLLDYRENCRRKKAENSLFRGLQCLLRQVSIFLTGQKGDHPKEAPQKSLQDLY